ncbi:HAD family hydrolase [Roseovarius sp. B08]|uniref:HAD family hydrolase n=1 Tax=Roseovarius sp. B08 TaxID=3449223 RepID=UPI003EDC7EB8
MTPASVTDLPPVFDGIKAVCFDAFGTLVEITDKRLAFRPLFKALPPEKRRALKLRLMREDRPFTDWPEALGAEVDPMTLLEVMERMMIETGSIALRPGMAGIWARLRGEGLSLALCSNLASDYVTALRSALPDPPDVEVLFCKVRAIKPEPAIYAAMLDGLQVDPGKVLLIGDNPRADIEGPRAEGMKAMHIDELVAAMQPG